MLNLRYKQNGNFDKIYKIVDEAMKKGDNFNFIFMGDAGLGKTMIANRVFEIWKKRFEKNGYSEKHYENPAYLKAYSLYEEYINRIKSKNTDANEQMRIERNKVNRKFVVIDELGAEKTENASNYVESFLLGRYNYLSRSKGSTIITTNLKTSEELSNKYGERILDRLCEHFTFVFFRGKSQRRTKIKIIK